MLTFMLEKIILPTHLDSRGSLTVLELKDFIDFEPKRIYYVTDVKGSRGGHAVRGEKKIYVCMQGSCKGRFHDGIEWTTFDLKGPSEGIKMDSMCFREFTDFTPGTVLMAVSSVNYNKNDYIFDFDEFLREMKKDYNHLLHEETP